MSVTFVTSYLKIYDTEYCMNKTFEKRLSLFKKIVNTGVNICIFCSPEFKDIFTEIDKKYDNVKLIDIYDVNKLKFSQKNFPEIEKYKLPDNINVGKDTKYYMQLMNSKIDFVNEAIKIDPFSSKYFCWFDFSLPYIFKRCNETINKFKLISQYNYIDSFLIIGGINNKLDNINNIMNDVYWRFCGGFFMGDKESLIKFYNLSYENYSEFLSLTKTVMWEVNYWAWLESYKNFKPIWYRTKFDDSIITIPCNLYCKN